MFCEDAQPVPVRLPPEHSAPLSCCSDVRDNMKTQGGAGEVSVRRASVQVCARLWGGVSARVWKGTCMSM